MISSVLQDYCICVVYIVGVNVLMRIFEHRSEKRIRLRVRKVQLVFQMKVMEKDAQSDPSSCSCVPS